MKVDVSKLRLRDVAAVVGLSGVPKLEFFEVRDGQVTGVFE